MIAFQKPTTEAEEIMFQDQGGFLQGFRDAQYGSIALPDTASRLLWPSSPAQQAWADSYRQGRRTCLDQKARLAKLRG